MFKKIMYSTRKLVILAIIVSFMITVNRAREPSNRNRHNLFDPIYAFDDIDAHTVTAGSSHSTSSASSNLASASQQPQPLRSTITSTTRRQRQFDDKPTSILPLSTTSSLSSSSIEDKQPTLTRFRSLPNEIQRNKKEIIGTSTQKALITPTFGSSARLLDARNAKLINQQDNFDSNNQQQPPHWSALENYYQKLRQISLPKQQQQTSIYDNQQSPIYQVIQQQDTDDLLIGGFKGNSPYQSINNNNNNNNGGPVIYVSSPVKSPSPFLLPTSSPNQNQNQKTQPQVIGLLPIVDDSNYSSQRQYTSGISRIGGIGADSILQADNYNNNNNNNQQEQLINPIINDYLNNYNNQQLKNRLIQQQLATKGILINNNNNNDAPFTLSNSPTIIGEDGRVRYLEFRKLPELLLIQQQQQRAKHQQETFGSWYDHQRSKELLLEEAYCGPRNYLNLNVGLPSTSNKSLTKISNSTMTISKLQQVLQQEGNLNNNNAQSIDVPVTLNAGEYPSHMGIYNGSRPNDDNFLCSATWIHEQYALTSASCFKNIRDFTKLTIRAGEWNLNRNNSNSNLNENQKLSMIIRDIEQVYLFPKYRNDSIEHNLAIVKFSKPIDFLETPYICPACQIQSRTSLRTSNCWAPIRNITYSEYFDAEGEGETKEKKVINMIEVPIKLIANDDNECYRQTKIEFFNFQHPNYICSADYRLSRWRARLNETEYFGSGIYCNEGGNLSLVSILHPIQSNSSSTYGYIDLSYYKPWMRNIISGRSF